ncbi:MAG: glycerophosphodiester phosphodiesterase [Anaerolineae bacterium]|nr:glycerophosphodiester phosphodiesterase [Anaerolineae bacterium]MCK4449754.1 glycerophosphodiester phosphodiesterase [Anaerolineae bacterium]
MIHNIAHRGASAYEPENTLRAFERAIQMGATMLELDVHLSQDGHPVVVHDADLFRTTNSNVRIPDMTLGQIKGLDVDQGERVPTLSEAIELARGRAELYIELKGQRTPEPVVRALQASRLADQAVVGSFYPWLPQRVKFMASTIRTSVLIGQENRQADSVEWALAVEADYIHLCWENASPTPHRLLTPVMLAGIRQHGLGIILWHEERLSEVRELVKFDVDGICTDTPDVLSAILRTEDVNTHPAARPGLPNPGRNRRI